MTQPTIHTQALIPEPTAQDQEERLKDVMTKVYELLDEAKTLIPFFKAVVEYEGKEYWAELQLNRNPINYPDVEEYYWQSKFGLPNAHGFWFDLYELKRDYGKNPIIPYRPHTGSNKAGKPTLTAGNAFDKLRPTLNGSYRLEKLKVIKKIC